MPVGAQEHRKNCIQDACRSACMHKAQPHVSRLCKCSFQDLKSGENPAAALRQGWVWRARPHHVGTDERARPLRLLLHQPQLLG